jgi:N-acetylmuramoyl-L-alanine amidase
VAEAGENMRREFLELCMGLTMVAIVFAVFHTWNASKSVSMTVKPSYTVVLDAGHGGDDPGKVGVDGVLEKDINLSLVYQIKAYLEAEDVTVLLTREGDEGLYGTGEANKKRADLEKRCEKIENWAPDAVISIHQNSYHEEAICGPQVFYYAKSEEGKELAEIIQTGFDRVLGDQNTREAKGNEDYYLLLHTSCPVVIVECGFLSNWEECTILQDNDYQDQLAWAIHLSILQYLNGKSSTMS